MKRKLFDLRVWHRTLDAGTQTVHRLPGGLLVDYRAGEVVKPLIVPFGGRTYCILNTDYRWVHYVPAGARHALTVQLDDKGQLQQLYVDIIQGSGTGKDGLPWIDDLYLDVAGVVEISPDASWTVCETEVLDEDELDEALSENRITPQQHAQAWAETRAVLTALTAGTFAPLDVLRRYLQDPYT